MKDCIKYTLAIILMIAYTGVSAQIKSRYTGGLNISTMKLKAEGLNSEPTSPLGIHFGYLFEIPVIGGFTFQPGILFSAKGTDYRLNSINHSLSPIYIEVPANAALTIGGDRIKIYILAGPYIAFGVGGTIWESGQSVKDLKFGKGSGKDLRFIDTGINFSAGAYINKFMVTVQYGLGLANVAVNDPDIEELKNRVIGVSFGAAFGPGKRVP